uniref:Ubiquitin-like protein 4A n=1 Tax=Lygus hesperus TaxID=30085 RepID=A0A0A9Z5X8_LYGHE
MKITVKILQGQETTLEVSDQTSVKDLKQHVFQTLKVPVNQQKLLLTGKPLSDEKYLVDYPLIKDGTKINLVVKKTDEDSVLRVAITNFLRKSYNEQDSQKIADEFMKEFYRSMSTLNLEDIERIASTYYSEDELAS